MLIFSNVELDQMPPLGKTVKCWICGKRHQVYYGKKLQPDGTLAESKVVAFMVCGGQDYLCGINGRKWVPKRHRAGQMQNGLPDGPFCIRPSRGRRISKARLVNRHEG